jgi:hypothetical protein
MMTKCISFLNTHSLFISDCVNLLQPFKCRVCAATRALLNLNSHCWTVFSLSDEKDVQSICLLKVNISCSNNVNIFNTPLIYL